MAEWDGKTKGSLWGYKFFIFCIRFFGLNISYFFCYFVSLYYVWFSAKQRDALIQFYQKGLQKNKTEARKLARSNFYIFGQTLIDRIALHSTKKKSFTYSFNNEKVLKEMSQSGTGGILISGHIGNWENAGNLIRERITSAINVVMLDAEVQKIKSFLEIQTGGPKFNLIPIKDDMSHLILIHQALKRKEFIAIHADRTVDNSNNFKLDFLGHEAQFPKGPFILAEKFNVPITFVYAAKGSKFHYDLFATDPINEKMKDIDIAKRYVQSLENMVKKYPNQWFNFFKYYAD